MNIENNILNSTWIVLPAFNEGEAITTVIVELKKTFKNILVIDDCSSDDTQQISQQCGVITLRHPINLGQGAALQTGIDFALQSGAQIIATFDSDGQHSTEDLIRMIGAIDVNKCEVICGSRFLGVVSENMPKSKRITLKMATIFTKLITGISVTDAHNGLRVFTKSAAKLIVITQNRMAHATEIISLIKKHNITYREYPVKITYTKYSMSKGQKISNIINILSDLLLGGGIK